MNILKRLRVIIALFFIVFITLLFLDFTGTIHGWMGWMAKVQFLPALLALNLGVVIGLILLTLIFGRVYCSMICPMGIFQDLVACANRKKNKYHYSPPKIWMRYGIFALLIIAFIGGVGSVVALVEPYGAYGRMVSNLASPFYDLGNNLLAYIASRVNSYAFYSTDVWLKSLGTFIIALATLVIIGILAWRNGRTFCNTICPVGTILGFFSRFSLYRHQIDTDKCINCGACARNCKAACIDPKAHKIDNSRCVTCFNCIDKCSMKAISYKPVFIKHKENVSLVQKEPVSKDSVDSSRRNMLTLAGALVATTVIKAQEKKVDGGLAFIKDKKIPKRLTPIVPPGAQSIRNFTTRCTACQLCVEVCPNQVLRPSSNLATFMQPEVSYERGYCRPECVKCSEVCPAGAIQPINIADKSSIQIGNAVWIEKNCVVISDDVECGNCARHCPTGAITMIENKLRSTNGKKIPMINIERCIGCGACENLCPARPFSAIYVEGHTKHRRV